MELFRHPAVKLVGVSENPGFGSSIETMNRKVELRLPAMARRRRALEVQNDLFPGLEDLLFLPSGQTASPGSGAWRPSSNL